MTMTEPIADMLTRIRNANTAHFDTVRMPGSRLKESLAAILADEGYIVGYQVNEDPDKPGKTLEITMKYSPERETDDFRHQTGVQARPAHLRPSRQDAPGARRPRGGSGLHLQGPDDRPRSTQAPYGRRGALLCLVAGPRDPPAPHEEAPADVGIGRSPIAVSSG